MFNAEAVNLRFNVAGVLLADPFPCVQIVGVEAAKDQPSIAELNFSHKVTHISGIDIARAVMRHRRRFLIDRVGSEIRGITLKRRLCLLRRRFAERELWPLPIRLYLHRHDAGRVVVDIAGGMWAARRLTLIIDDINQPPRPTTRFAMSPCANASQLNCDVSTKIKASTCDLTSYIGCPCRW